MAGVQLCWHRRSASPTACGCHWQAFIFCFLNNGLFAIIGLKVVDESVITGYSVAFGKPASEWGQGGLISECDRVNVIKKRSRFYDRTPAFFFSGDCDNNWQIIYDGRRSDFLV